MTDSGTDIDLAGLKRILAERLDANVTDATVVVDDQIEAVGDHGRAGHVGVESLGENPLEPGEVDIRAAVGHRRQVGAFAEKSPGGPSR